MKDFILLIPYFNDLEGLIASLKSINYPTHEFEVLVVDDGSKIPLNEEVLRTKFPNINITVLTMPANAGVAKALNTGLKLIHSRNDFKYIARLDCGDTCSNERFIEQVKFMNEHSEIGLLGTWCRFTDTTSGKSYLYKTRTTHIEIVKEMYFKCSFIHPTVMFRKEVLDIIGYYPENYPHAEDYAFFWKILKHYRGEILSDIYVDIVSDMRTISANNYNNQAVSRAKIINDMGTTPSLKYTGILSAYLRMFIPYRLIIRAKFLFFK